MHDEQIFPLNDPGILSISTFFCQNYHTTKERKHPNFVSRFTNSRGERDVCGKMYRFFLRIITRRLKISIHLERIQGHHAHGYVCIFHHLAELFETDLPVQVLVGLHHCFVHNLKNRLRDISILIFEHVWMNKVWGLEGETCRGYLFFGVYTCCNC